MKAHYSAGQLAGMGLPGFPGTERGIQSRADRDQWPFMYEKVRGGHRKLYLSHLLPDPVREAILDQEKIDALIVAPGGNHPATIDQAPICENQQNKAMLKADLLRLYLQALSVAAWGKKDQARTDFMIAYNSGIAYPEIFKGLGELSWKTIEGWKKKLEKNKGDTLKLADRRGHHKRGKSGLTSQQTDILLRCALHPNKPRLSEAIRMAHAIMHTKSIENGHSAATYRRWLKNWASRNHHIWVFNREGAKAWNDKCAFYIERDYNLINVGDVVVADGHVLNFEIINPWTGKPKRMMLIVWLDMKSGYPLGWEIMPTEDTAAISSALRRAILRLGKYPQVAYLDNGKAFRARFFKGCTNFDEAGFAGLYERLGMKTIFAWPYHGQSKTVERFFGTFAELERWCPTYTGTSIEHKPPRMNRGEKLHRKVYEKATNGQCLTLEQAHRAIASWFDVYAKRPQRGHLNGRSPLEVFMEGKGDGVDKANLSYLMMSLEIKHIRQNGISFHGRNYYHPALYGRRHPVMVRYDLQDKSALYVFELNGDYICEAGPVEGVHPAATVLGNDEDRAKLTKHIELKKHQEKEASISARAFLEDEILPQHQRQLANIGILPGSNQQNIKQLPPKPLVVDEKKLMAEVKELEDYQAKDDAACLRRELESLNEMDRYEKLLEMRVRGILLCEEYQAFVAYFEKTSHYRKSADYYEEYEQKIALMHQLREEK